MAIVTMKRLRLLGMQSDRDSLFHALQKLGCVEISEPAIDLTDPQWAALAKPEGHDLAEAKEQNNLLNTALETLKKYTPPKSEKSGLLAGRPEITDAELFDESAYRHGLEVAGAVMDGERNIAALIAEQAKLEGQKAALTPWLSLDVPLELKSTEHVSLVRGTVPARTDWAAMEAALHEASELSCVYEAGSDSDLRYVLVLCHKSVEQPCLDALRAFGFSHVVLSGWTGSAVDNQRALDNRLNALTAKIAEARELMVSYVPEKAALRRCIDRSSQDIACEEAKGRLVDTSSTFFLQGWLPAEKEKALADVLGGYTCAWETQIPGEEEYPEVPVKLKNNGFTRPLNMVTEMYSLPAYSGIDPNPLMAPFFILFYGMMMADMAYGLIMMIMSLVVNKKKAAQPGSTMDHLFRLMGLCGISTFIFGAITGGFFGDFIPQVVKIINPNTTFTALPALFTPVNDTLMILVGSLALGLIQIFVGMAVSLIRKLKKHEFASAIKDEIAWYVVFILIAAAVLTGAMKPCLIAIVVVLLATQWIGGKGVVGKLTSIGGSLYNNITGYFSDILSYARLMALMLSGAVVAQVFNTLGAIPGNIVIFVIISLVGNALNFALNLLGCYVHDLRLQCLEYFNRFYEDGGRAFKPLEIKTKYVDISEKN